MASTTCNSHHHAQIVGDHEVENNQFSSPIFIPPPSHRTPSLSSLSSLSSSGSSSLSSPTTPLRFSGIPFSWEKLPGIPKQQQLQISKKNQSSSLNLLPLPPAGFSISSKKCNNGHEDEIYSKKNTAESFRFDPFFAAMVECSKDDYEKNGKYWKGSKITRTLSDRIGFINMYTSCKRSCGVSESIVYLPRRSRSTYDLLNRRSS